MQLRLLEVQVVGVLFTWCNQQLGQDCIKEKIGRVIACPSWIQHYLEAKVYSLGPMTSDHLPMLPLENNEENFPKTFRFKNFRILDHQFENVTEGAWKMEMKGSQLFRVCSNLKHVKTKLKGW